MIRFVHVNDIPTSGFAGIVETQMVKSPRLWPTAQNQPLISHGLGDFVYLANGYFKPNDGVPIHPHKDVDIASFIVSGAVGHEGTLGHGTTIQAPGVQIQRAGTGMQHSEFNLTDNAAEIIQLWFLPPSKGLSPAYQNIVLQEGELTTVLGDVDKGTFDNNMLCQIGYLTDDQRVEVNQPFIALITRGEADVNGQIIDQGTLVEGDSAIITGKHKLGIVLITTKG
ncbi:pirin family protein [Thalassotalea maritima]|uniref:pirin family protein n=1 Tax=Thalassotalea maritima TaxID=3242416 RepID=UPI0035285D75